jgi:hypothetical protein
MAEDINKRRWCTTGNTSEAHPEDPRSNRGRRTHYGEKYLDDRREELKEKGTIFDDKLGEEYHKVWKDKTETVRNQQTLDTIQELTVHDVTFERVDSKSPEAKKWKYIADNFHYVPHSPSSVKPYGRFLRYFIKVNGEVVGIIAVAGSFLSLEARDRYIGWNKTQRMRNNKKICQNLVYCILPTYKVPNMSSQILAQFAKIVRKDWKEHYGDNLVLMDTLVDPALYKGTSYKAAGWAHVGMTKGFGGKSVRMDKKGYGPRNMGRVLFRHDIPKMIFVKPLHRYWRKELTTEPSSEKKEV